MADEVLELTVMERHQKMTQAEKIEQWKKKYTYKQLVAACEKEGVVTDDTLDKTKVAKLLYAKAEQKFMDQLSAEQSKAAEDEADLANEVDPAGANEVLGPMKKPSKFRILKANAKIYDGILKTRTWQDGKGRKMITAVTGTGQYWDFCLDNE